MKKETDAIRTIIKYNPRREYFGEWTPSKLYSVFNSIRQDPFRPLSFVSLGGLSAGMICDALWNEMSYNPLRFGETNPFETNDISAIRKFHKKYETSDTDTMSKTATELRHFLYFIGQSNPEFYKLGRISGNSILIKCDYNKNSNDGYKALSCLAHAVHYIASQNLQDYKNKTFRQKIVEIATARHPNLQRPWQYLNFVALDRILAHKDYLYSEIMKTTNDILDTTTRIKTLGEYDPPADTSDERALLLRQTADLQNLEEQYAATKQQYNRMITLQKTR